MKISLQAYGDEWFKKWNYQNKSTFKLKIDFLKKFYFKNSLTYYFSQNYFIKVFSSIL